MTLHAYDSKSTASEHNSVNFTLTLEANEAPTNTTTFPDKTVSARIPQSFDLPSNFFSNEASETLNYSYTVDPATPLIV